jgi:hypothetical protein
MFVQLIEGTTSDPDGLRRQLETWEREVKPGAIGFLGSSGGVADDGTFFMAARFESPEAAKRNSDRPEQDTWWKETEKYLDGVTFVESTDVETWGAGGSDEAGFVQVMQATTTDPARLKALDDEFQRTMGSMRPDIIGGLTIDHGAGRTTSIAYFTSEAEAREGERKEMPPEMAKVFSEWQSLMQDTRYIDLTDPFLSSP